MSAPLKSEMTPAEAKACADAYAQWASEAERRKHDRANQEPYRCPVCGEWLVRVKPPRGVHRRYMTCPKGHTKLIPGGQPYKVPRKKRGRKFSEGQQRLF